MPIKPVDFQVIIPKASEVSKINSADQQREQVLAQQLASTTERRAANSLKQVYHQDKANEAQIRERQKGKSNEDKENRKKGKLEKEGKDKAEIETHIIDIKI